MKKTTSINVQGTIFHIDKDAGQLLQEYLASLKKYFEGYDDRDEIIADIESRIVEKFSTYLTKRKQAITKTDVQKLIRAMGKVEDFTMDDEKQEKQKTTRPVKRLYRNSDEAMLGGVCAGIAAYCGIDSVFIRLLFVLSIFLGGTGIVLYFLLWIIVPQAKTTTEKMQMKGDPITIHRIEQALQKKRISKTALQTSLKNVREPIEKLGTGIKFLAPAIAVFFGVIATITALVGFVGITFVIGVFALKGDVWSIYLGYTEVLSENIYYGLLMSSYVVALIPLVFILLLGISLTKRKNVFSALSIGTLLTVWLFGLVAFGVIAVDIVPEYLYIHEEYHRLHDTYDNGWLFHHRFTK